jgi:DNA-binding NarL/FixJ family response regulator
MTSLILADDHQILREALCLLIETQHDFQVLAETGDGQTALQLLEKYQPDIIIADLMMPGLSGLELARAAKRLAPATKVIMLSMYDMESYVVEALRMGVAGYVLKNSSSQELIFAIRQALAGHQYLSPALNQRALAAYLQRSAAARSEDPYETLTPREHEVFQLAVEGLSNPQIAERLALSARTVEMHRSHLLKKLGLKTQTDLVKFAVHRGLV